MVSERAQCVDMQAHTHLHKLALSVKCLNAFNAAN